MPDRRVDLIARERIEEIAAGYEKHTGRMTWYLRAFVILFFVCAVVFTVQQNALGNRAAETRRLTEANGRLAGEIQDERARSVRASCQEVNDRHDTTIATLDKLLAKLPPSQRARAKSSRDGTVLLIEALAPKRNCEALVRRTVGHRP